MTLFKTFTLYLCLILIMGCTRQNGVIINDIGVKGRTLPVNDLDLCYNNTVINGEEVSVVFLNNPANIKDSDKVLLYFNNALIYFGAFNKTCTAIIPKDTDRDGLVHFSLKIAKVDSQKGKATVYNIQNKDVVKWNSNSKLLYIAFFPTNQNMDKVSFIPMSSPI